ncbi:MAG: hypothetical protein M3O31_11930 [Acidobacteriota bacterium]|nr:hypothetical protein [Acidobacteriota bacterium]
MPPSSPTSASTAAQPGPQAPTPATLFGVPVGDFGWFASLLIGLASGFMAFFAATFCAIVFILIYNTTAHGSIDFAYSYRRVGFPIGIVVMAVAFTYLASLWFKRILRRS